ncbi:uncharacterized protein LOC106179768 [Lingula anatina]|uniref:Uncharacterized protein LOC106179768 n=1 Tax=Lingula anatina TaxID=7574 RepID=A0A1S3K8L6_LINAN|nr:uncharacterized protein LOC106179768 [Lingula anatina]|eukprot:XP_013418968.1 uncharacterized protein LOC106179768 [Lingula anatina]
MANHLASNGSPSKKSPVPKQEDDTAAEDDSNSIPKIDPSFKSKRYRDKLRTEIKALESQLPLDKTSLHRKLDSQTVFRLVISCFRMKAFFKAARFVDRDPNPTDNLESKPPEEDTIMRDIFDAQFLNQSG